MAKYITKIRTAEGDKRIDFNALANIPASINPEYIKFWIEEATGYKGTFYDGTLGLEYEISDDETHAYCTSYHEAIDMDIKISSSYYGKPVTSISGQAFFRNENLTSVEIPKTVTVINMEAFKSCSNLKRVDLSNHSSVPVLYRSGIFDNCHENLQIKVPASLLDEWKSATNWSEYADKIVTQFTN